MFAMPNTAQDIYRKAKEELGRMPGMKPGVVERRGPACCDMWQLSVGSAAKVAGSAAMWVGPPV